MVKNSLFRSINEKTRSAHVRDQIQMALAIADPTLLRSLLINSVPVIADPMHIGSVSSDVGIPVAGHSSADGILQYEAIQCVLAAMHPQPELSNHSGWTKESKELARMTQHESELHTLVQNLPMAPAIALLSNAGFRSDQVNEILRLPHYAWHKSWWYAIDPDGNFTLPFLRCIRTLHYPDGTLTLQYRDFFDQEKPACFTSLSQKVLIAVRSDSKGFADTLEQINYQREALNLQRAVLICTVITELEAQAFTRQGISLYPVQELVLPVQASCERCGRYECPLNHRLDSPVVMCRGFLLEGEFV